MPRRSTPQPGSPGATVSAIDLSDAQSRVLATIRGAGEPVTVLTMAKALDVHPNTVRFHVEALEAKGLVEKGRQPTGGKGRPRLTYAPTEAGSREGERNFKLLADVLIEHLITSAGDPDAAARAAGREWGSRLAGTRRAGRSAPQRVAAEVLAEMGFEPDLPGGRTNASGLASFLLRNCPFREAVDRHQEVVCAVHQGLLEGIVGAGPRSVPVQLLPFAERGACAVRFGTA
jgi:predicted ArsR family transcriptional regulator